MATKSEPAAGPVDLAAVLWSAMSGGAVCFGAAVERVAVVTEDGERRVFALPRPPDPEPAGGFADWTPTRRRIVAALAESPVPLTRKQVGLRIGRKVAGGRFLEDVRALLAGGRLHERYGLLADDPAKFPQSPD